MEVVLPGSMTVQESHDIALALQHKIERLDDVERAFVHVDHLGRDGLEHKVERELVLLNRVELERQTSGGGLLESFLGPSSGNELRSRARVPPI